MREIVGNYRDVRIMQDSETREYVAEIDGNDYFSQTLEGLYAIIDAGIGYGIVFAHPKSVAIIHGDRVARGTATAIRRTGRTMFSPCVIEGIGNVNITLDALFDDGTSEQDLSLVDLEADLEDFAALRASTESRSASLPRLDPTVCREELRDAADPEPVSPAADPAAEVGGE